MSFETIIFQLSDEALDFILNNKYQPEFGGRSLRRVVDQWIAEPLTNLIASKQLKNGDVVAISLGSGVNGLRFHKVAESLSGNELHILYRNIYGRELEKVVSEGARGDYGDQYSPGRFSEYLEKIISTRGEGDRLRLIDLYIHKTPVLTDTQFLVLLEHLPKSWDWGHLKSDVMTRKMRELNLGDWATMNLEPARLRFYWYGMSRLTSLSRANRRAMSAVLEPMNKDILSFFKKRNFKSSFTQDVLTLVQNLHALVMDLPESVEE